jgi:hypothetical protein
MNRKDEQLIGFYRQCFGSVAGREVLADLMQFCHFRVPLQTSGNVPDPNALLVAEGARHVFLRILTIMCLTQDQIIELYSGKRFQLEEEDAA